MIAIFRTVACLTALAALAQGQLNPNVDLLGFRVIDAEYSASLERIVAASDTPANQVHVYDPVAQADSTIGLPLPPTSISVGPSGQFAAVGHDGWVSYVDLSTSTLIKTMPISTDVFDVVLAGNGFIYGMPRTGQWVNVHCVEIATEQETLSTGRSVRQGTRMRLHPNGQWIYGADNGLSPSDIEKYDISAGTAQYLYDSPYHGTYSMAGDLWISADGLRIFVRGGNVFRSSAIQVEDMVYNGSLSQLSLVEAVAHAPGLDRLFAVPEAPFFGGSGDDTELQEYDYTFLAHRTSHTFPQVGAGGSSYDTHGRYLFVDGTESNVYALVQVDPTAGFLFDYGVVTLSLQPNARPLEVDVTELSVMAGGTQTLSLDAGSANAGRPYLVLGSANGTAPGTPYGGWILPLNFEPVYFLGTLVNPNKPPLGNSLGLLDSTGQATASVSVPPMTTTVFAGMTLHHAFTVFDGARGQVVFVSNAAPLNLMP